MKIKLTFFIIFVFVTLSEATDIYSGPVNGVWNATGSPYLIHGEISIPADQSLTIEPGVEVIFQGYYEFAVLGKLTAIGAENDSILVTAANTDEGWHGMRFVDTETNGQDGSVLSYCIFEYGNALTGDEENNRGGALSCLYSSDLQILGCRFSHNQADYGGAMELRYSDVTIQDCMISNNHASHDAGGIIITDESEAVISNSIIRNNSCLYNGGGIYCCNNASPTLNDVLIRDNSTICEENYCEPGGGGISCHGGSLGLNNVSLLNNISMGNGTGGGLESKFDAVVNYSNGFVKNNQAILGGGILSSATISLSGVTISENISESAGGLYLAGIVEFDPDNRCSIYSNLTTDSETGYDIKTGHYNYVDVIVDTFSVLHPNNTFAYPICCFNFDILHHQKEQVFADLYVSPSGSDDNGGLTPEDPLKTITYALSIIAADSLETHTIFLDEGTYSPSLTWETFPLSLHPNITIEGTSTNLTILDAENTSSLILEDSIKNSCVRNMKIIHFSSYAAYIAYSESNFHNVVMIGDETNSCHAVIHTNSSTISLDQVVFYNIMLQDYGRVISSQSGDIIITNSTFYTLQNEENIFCLGSSNSNIFILNSIFYNCSDIKFHCYSSFPCYLNLAYNDIEGDDVCQLSGQVQINWLEGNIDVDPLFCDPLSGDFYLQDDSPCIDTGTAYYEWNGEVILDLSPEEYYGDAPDMGAFEWEGIGIEDCILKIEDLELTNYPNPFNPSTTISFNLNADDAKDAKIEIYNLKGQKVKTLPVILSGVEGSANHQIIKSQNHQIVWNGRDENNKPVGSGVYFYKLKAGKLKKTKKMLLIK